MNDRPPNAGYRVLLLDTKSQNPNHYICLAIRDALKSAVGIDLVVKAELHNAVSLAIEHRCNLFFAFDGEALERIICARTAAVCGLSILWVTEDPYETSVNVANADLFDLVFTNDSACVAAYGRKGRHLPLAGAKAFHLLAPREQAEALRYDLFFAGTAWPNRVQLIKDILATDAGKVLKAKIALPTNEHLPPLDVDLPPSRLNWRTAPPDFARFANMSVVTLLLPRVFSASGNRDFAETPPPRLYEAALAGTVQIVQSSLAEASKDFEAGKDFLYFETAAEAVALISKLRADFSLRSEIARNAQVKALALHCYEHRVAKILNELRALQSSGASAVPAVPSGKPKLLFVAHNTVPNPPFGGVEVYLQHIAEALAGQYDIYVYVAHFDAHRAFVVDGKGRAVKTHQFAKALSPWQLSCREREEAFASTLTELGISLVHFHHFIGQVPSLVEIAKALGFATVMTVHDYYGICHNFTLLSHKGTYCHPDEISLAQCDVCLYAGHRLPTGSQAIRRAYWDHILAAIDSLVFNTASARELAARIYPAVATHKNTAVLPVPRDRPARQAMPLKREQKLKVAILGNFDFHKGGDVMASVMALFKGGNVEFHIFGNMHANYHWLEDSESYPFIHVYGGYRPGDLPTELYDCHVSLHLSIWPETYCLSLSEAWDAGLVPIVSDIGALGERVSDGINGIKIPVGSEGALEQALRRLAETPGELEAMRSHMAAAPIARTEQHIEDLKAIYRSRAHIAAFPDEASHAPMSLDRLQRSVPVEWRNRSGDNASASERAAALHALAREIKLRLRHMREVEFFSTLRRRGRAIALKLRIRA